jgi:glyoxylase-like metal-dependent hydrolase (beta-lactamase superfamily II)
MKLSYRHASITAGNELSLLRCQSDSRSREASCVLVDAGTGLDVADLLGPADDPVAVCLAHADHYQSLGECVRVGATVYRESRQSVRGRTEIEEFRDDRWTPSTEPASG